MSAEFLNDLRTRPTFMVSYLSDMFFSPEKFTTDTRSYRLALATQFRAALCGKPLKKQIGNLAWNAMLDRGLPIVYADIITSPDFFSRPPDVIQEIVNGFQGIFEQIENDPVASIPLLERTIPLWSSIWDRRVELQEAEGPEYKQKLIMPLIELVYRFSDLYHTVLKGLPPPEDSHMHHVGLLLYVLSEQDVKVQTLPFSLRCLAFMHGRPARLLLGDNAGVQARLLVGPDVQAQIGYEKMILRFKTTLITPEPLDVYNLNLAILALWILACSPATRPFFDKHGIFQDVNRAISQNAERYELEDRLSIWHLANDALGLLYAGRLEPGTPANLAYVKSIRGEDITDHFARGIKLAAETNGNMIYDFNQDPSSSLRQDIQDHNKFIGDAMHAILSADDPSKIDRSTLILAGSMRRRAREVWWPSLCSLQKVAYRRLEIGAIVDVWREYGSTLGLEEEKEKEKEKERHQSASLLDAVYRTCQAVLYWPWGGA